MVVELGVGRVVRGAPRGFVAISQRGGRGGGGDGWWCDGVVRRCLGWPAVRGGRVGGEVEEGEGHDGGSVRKSTMGGVAQ
jgi:hypothetical protein